MSFKNKINLLQRKCHIKRIGNTVFCTYKGHCWNTFTLQNCKDDVQIETM